MAQAETVHLGDGMVLQNTHLQVKNMAQDVYRQGSGVSSSYTIPRDWGRRKEYFRVSREMIGRRNFSE